MTGAEAKSDRSGVVDSEVETATGIDLGACARHGFVGQEGVVGRRRCATTEARGGDQGSKQNVRHGGAWHFADWNAVPTANQPK